MANFKARASMNPSNDQILHPQDSTSPEVTTPTGVIQGSFEKGIYSFTGLLQLAQSRKRSLGAAVVCPPSLVCFF
jgi:hypothetical protein